MIHKDILPETIDPIDIRKKTHAERAGVILSRIRVAMALQNISKGGLAVMLNVAPRRVNKMLSSESNMTMETLFALEDALEISLFDYTLPKL